MKSDEMKNERPDGKLKKNANILLCILLVIVLALDFGGIFRAAVVKGAEYKAKANEHQMNDNPVDAPRGTIYDRNLNVIAESTTAWNLCATPQNLYKRKKDKAEALAYGEQLNAEISKFLSETLDVDYDTVHKKLSNPKSQYAELKKQVSSVKKGIIQEYIRNHKYGGILYFKSSSIRYYQKNNFASNVLGFTNKDGEGKAGVELMYNDVLTGTPGRITTAQDANQNAMSVEYDNYIEPVSGEGLVLTIDENIQHYLEKSLSEGMVDYKTHGAYGIVMDVKTGAVLAMSSKPDYDTNNAYSIYDENVLAELEQYKNDEKKYSDEFNNALFKQWNNRAVSFVYEPGSVFKIFTLAAGIEEGVVSEQTNYCCTGVYNIGGWPIHCAHRQGHGTQTMRQGLMNSCNPFFIYVGQKLGTDRYFKYFEAFGFTEKTGIDLPGEAQPTSGITYHPKDNFSAVNLASTSFGQTVKVSPIQIITAACAIANGGKLMKPYVVAGTVDEDGNMLSTTEPTVRRQVISESTAKTVCSMMESVVSGGTGKNAYIAGYRVAGKTATSQKIKESEEANKQIWSGSFVCFAPADDPEIACLVVMDEPQGVYYGGSVIAAPVAKQVMEEALVYLNIEPEYTDSELENVNSFAPKLVGNSVSEAKLLAANQGYTIKVVGSGDKVISQTPAAKQSIPKGGVIIVYTDGDQNSSRVDVPDFNGMSISSVNQLAVSKGINITYSGPQRKTGTMRAYKQSVGVGEMVEAGSCITVYFKEMNSSDDTTD